MPVLNHRPQPLIEPDYYPATIKDITVEESATTRADGSKEYLQWIFAVQVNGETAPVNLTAFSSLKFGGGNKPAKARKWAEAVLGRTFTAQEAEEGLNTDELIGLSCRVNITNATLDDGTAVNRIADVAAPKERRKE
jgi:hypothetical protein